MTNNNILPEGHTSLMTLNGRHFTATMYNETINGKIVVDLEMHEVYLENDGINNGNHFCPDPTEYNYMIHLCEGSECNLKSKYISNFYITD
jgi:hypothetical protein